MFMCVLCVDMWGGSMYMRMHLEAKVMLGVFDHSQLYLLRQNLSLNLKLTNSACPRDPISAS